MTDPALFAVDGADGLAVTAMRSQIEAWQTAGQAVSTIERRALIDQAHAVDMARAARRPTAISGAHKVLVEMLQAFRLLDDSPPPATGPDDPFQRFLAAVSADGAGS